MHECRRDRHNESGQRRDRRRPGGQLRHRPPSRKSLRPYSALGRQGSRGWPSVAESVAATVKGVTRRDSAARVENSPRHPGSPAPGARARRPARSIDVPHVVFLRGRSGEGPQPVDAATSADNHLPRKHYSGRRQPREPRRRKQPFAPEARVDLLLLKQFLNRLAVLSVPRLARRRRRPVHIEGRHMDALAQVPRAVRERVNAGV